MIVAVVLLVVVYILLYKTKFGLRLMACGENPQAADSVGINVYKMRWAGVLISGFLGGLGGIVYITAGVSEWKFEMGVAGFGFLALAVMIFGQWKPTNIALAALLTQGSHLIHGQTGVAHERNRLCILELLFDFTYNLFFDLTILAHLSCTSFMVWSKRKPLHRRKG
jgi:ABC-type uncharacterized transport system permease subunit